MKIPSAFGPGILVLALTVPVGFIAMLSGAFMCDAPRSDATACDIVGYGPEMITGLLGLALIGRAAVRLVHENRDQR